MKTTDDIIDELRLAATSDPAPAGLSGLLTDAADRIEHLFASGIHTCHADCQRPMCVLRRERDKAHADLARVTAERDKSLRREDEMRVKLLKEIEGSIALARAESATPDAAECSSDYTSQLTEDKRNESAERMAGIQSLAESATPAKHCEDCAPEFGCWDGGEPCCKKPLVRSTPAKHPDTEIVDWLDTQFQGGDDWCRLFPLGNTIREAYAARKQETAR